MKGFRIGSLFGFEIRVDYSWFVIFFLILWWFSTGPVYAAHKGPSAGSRLLLGTSATFLFFASLLAHELSHTLVARRRGYEMGGITLFVFGAIAHAQRDATHPGDEFVIAGVGPLASLALGGLFAAGAWAARASGLDASVSGTATQLAWLNVLLAAFNLLPGFPLDGGRLFRASAWKVTGSFGRATRWATTAGRLLGIALLLGGAVEALEGRLVSGLWIALIGGFLHWAAASGWRDYRLRSLQAGASEQAGKGAGPHSGSSEITFQGS